MVLRRVSILLILFIFGMIVRAWSDSVKSINDDAIRLTTMKMDENKAALQKKTEPAKESTGWFKKSQVRPEEVDFLGTLEEKKKSQWVIPVDKAFYSQEFPGNMWRNKFLTPPQGKETKSSTSDLGQSTLPPFPEEDGYLQEGKILRALHLLQWKEEMLKDIFMGFRFSLDLTNGHALLEMNVTPSSGKRSGLTIRF